MAFSFLIWPSQPQFWSLQQKIVSLPARSVLFLRNEIKEMNKIIKFSSLGKAIMMVTAGMITLASCTKEDDTTPAVIVISEDDIAESIIRSVASSSNGISAGVIGAAHHLEDNRQECGIAKSNQVSYKNESKLPIHFTSSYKRDWLLSCTDANEPSHYSYSLSGTNAYDATNMSSDYQVNTEFIITGLEKNADQYNFEINHMETGDKKSKVGEKNQFSSSATYKSTDIRVDKESNCIVSGKIAVTLNNTHTDGSISRYGASISFDNNSIATLSFENGDKYTFSY
jgi:hypothetical protein